MIQQITEMLALATSLLHPMVTHFPLALLSASYLLDILAHWWPKLRTSGWVLLILGTIGAIFAVSPATPSGNYLRTPNSELVGGNPSGFGDRHHA